MVNNILSVELEANGENLENQCGFDYTPKERIVCTRWERAGTSGNRWRTHGEQEQPLCWSTLFPHRSSNPKVPRFWPQTTCQALLTRVRTLVTSRLVLKELSCDWFTPEFGIVCTVLLTYCHSKSEAVRLWLCYVSGGGNNKCALLWVHLFHGQGLTPTSL
jgi:hypothetical protein